MLRNFLFKRPDWFKHEGYWRLTQVLKLGPTFAFLAVSAFCLAASFYEAGSGGKSAIAAFGFAVAWFVGAVAYVIAMHWLIRLIFWITEGFKDGSKAAR
ncbi:hypothetical protein [Pseudomonas veronii]|jgi:hypothetical protein